MGIGRNESGNGNKSNGEESHLVMGERRRGEEVCSPDGESLPYIPSEEARKRVGEDVTRAESEDEPYKGVGRRSGRERDTGWSGWRCGHFDLKGIRRRRKRK